MPPFGRSPHESQNKVSDPTNALGESTAEGRTLDEARAFDAEFEDIDRQIEKLEARMESCRKSMIASRAAVTIGVLALVYVCVVSGGPRTPAIAIGAIAAILGGAVWLGSNRTTRDETSGALGELSARKERLFDLVASRNGWRDMTTTRH